MALLEFVRIKVKEAEAEMDYLGRCFSALNNKGALSEDDERELRRVIRKLRKVNDELAALWTQEEVIVDMAKAHAEGRSYFPIFDENGKELTVQEAVELSRNLREKQE